MLHKIPNNKHQISIKYQAPMTRLTDEAHYCLEFDICDLFVIWNLKCIHAVMKPYKSDFSFPRALRYAILSASISVIDGSAYPSEDSQDEQDKFPYADHLRSSQTDSRQVQPTDVSGLPPFLPGCSRG